MVLDGDGRSNFAKLARARAGSHYYPFDILALGNDELRGLPLSERKRLLETLVIECDPVRCTEVRSTGLEGIVAKRRQSLYAGTLTKWLKIRCLRVHDRDRGWSPDGREPFRELLLGEYIDGELRYVGRVGAGFSARVAMAIARNEILHARALRTIWCTRG